jgi:hypothetical protein
VGKALPSHAGEELFDLFDDSGRVLFPDVVVSAGELDELCAGDLGRHVAGAFDAKPRLVGSVQDERWHLDQR